MWTTFLLPITLLTLTSASTSNSNSPFLPFLEPFSDSETIDNATIPHLDLLKRQTSCPSGSNSCAWLNSGSNLCCKGSAICQADNAGHIACCPQGAVCTGTISGTAAATATFSSTAFAGVLTTTTAGGQTVTVGAGASQTTSGNIVFVQATGTASSASGRSYVSNPYFPFPYIPTTYANAASCSHAYSTCQSDASSCTAYLAGSAGGITISAPNGMGTTVAGPTTTYASAFASSACSSLSVSACYGLVMEACGNFGSGASAAGAAVRCMGMPYGVGVGAGVGIAMGVVGFR
jgi:hypothetical protein